MKSKNSTSTIALGLLMVCGAFFAMDYMVNSANSSTASLNEASILSLEIGAKDVEDKETVSINLDDFNAEPEIQFENNGLIEKDIFSSEFLAKEVLTLENIKRVPRLFEFFDIEELANAPLEKQILKSGEETIAYIYKFPSEAYALGLDYDSVASQIQPKVSSAYIFTEPSTFSKKSFYIVSNNGEGNVNAVAQIGNTLVGFEYSKANYQQLQKLIESLEIQEK